MGRDLTCVVTNFNHADTLGPCIESALAGGCEVFVVDNASTDESRRVLERYDVPGLYHRRNSGSPVRGYNEGIAACRTEWIVFLDADDLLLDPRPLVVEGADWVVANLHVRRDDGAVSLWDYAAFPRDLAAARDYAARKLSLPVSMKGAFRVSWLRRHGLRYLAWPARHHYSDDCLTCLEWLKASPRIAHVAECAVSYRYRSARPQHRDRFHADLCAYLERQR